MEMLLVVFLSTYTGMWKCKHSSDCIANPTKRKKLQEHQQLMAPFHRDSRVHSITEYGGTSGKDKLQAEFLVSDPVTDPSVPETSILCLHLSVKTK